MRHFLQSRCCLLLLASLAVAQSSDHCYADPIQDYSFAVGLYKQKRWDDAAKWLKDFLEKNPRHTKVPFAKLYLGHSLRNAGDYDEARTVLREFEKENPKNRHLPFALYLTAECSDLLGDSRSAAREWKQFLDRYPKDALVERAQPAYGNVQLRLKQFAGAARTFEEVLKRAKRPEQIEAAQYGLARSYAATDRKNDAIVLFERVANRRNGQHAADALFRLAELRYEDSQYRLAAEGFEELTRRFSLSRLVPEAHLNAGFAHYQLRNSERAISHFETAAKDEGQSEVAMLWKGITLSRDQDYETARDVFVALYTAHPQGTLADTTLFRLADCELRLRNYREAWSLFKEVREKWADSRWAEKSLHFSTEAALGFGDLDAAEAGINEFRDAYPRSGLAMRQRLVEAKLLIARDGTENLRSAAKMLRTVATGSKVESTRSLAKLQLAQTYLYLDDPERAATVLEPFIDSASDKHPEAHMLYGTAQLELGKYRLARTALTRFLGVRSEGSMVAQALAARCIAAANEGDVEAADTDRDRLEVDFPDTKFVHDVWRELADQAHASGELDRAETLFRNLAALGEESPDFVYGTIGIGWCQYDRDEFEQAAATFESILSTQVDDAPRLAEAAYMAGRAWQHADSLDRAAEILSAAFAKHAPTSGETKTPAPETAPFYAYKAGRELVRVQERRGKISEADKAYADLLDRFPQPNDLDEVLYDWAVMHQVAEDYTRSDEIYKRLLDEVPTSKFAGDARLSLAESQWSNANVDEARREFERLAGDRNAKDAVREAALGHLIKIGSDGGEWANVERWGTKFIKEFAQSEFENEVRFRLADSAFRTRNYKGAAQHLANLRDRGEVSNEEWYPHLLRLVADNHFHLKEYDKAIAAVEQMEKELADAPELYLGYDVLGRTYKSKGFFDEARDAFRKVVNSEAGKGTETAAKCQFLLAETFFFQERYQEASDQYFRLYTGYAFPEYQALGLLKTAACDEQRDRYTAAIQNYETLIEEFPESTYVKTAQARLKDARSKTDPAK